MVAHPIAESFDQGWQRPSLCERREWHEALTLQMFDKPFGPFQIATIPAAKGMRARARCQMTGKGVEHSLIELIYSNLFG